MSLTLEPDYHITSNGLPKLNTKKYKIYDKKSYRSKVENREQVLCGKNVKCDQENRLFGGDCDGPAFAGMETSFCCDNKKLLSKRANMNTPIDRLDCTNFDYHFHRRHGVVPKKSPTKIFDKELKCAINQKIKLCRNAMMRSRQNDTISSNYSNGMLDNRLAESYPQKYFNDHAETDNLTLDF